MNLIKEMTCKHPSKGELFMFQMCFMFKADTDEKGAEMSKEIGERIAVILEDLELEGCLCANKEKEPTVQ